MIISTIVAITVAIILILVLGVVLYWCRVHHRGCFGPRESLDTVLLDDVSLSSHTELASFVSECNKRGYATFD